VGLAQYLRAHMHHRIRNKLKMSAATLTDLATIVEANRWSLSGYATRHGRNPYPAGKIVDMAFFQYGYGILTRAQKPS
jgi:hypothetical protein